MVCPHVLCEMARWWLFTAAAGVSTQGEASQIALLIGSFPEQATSWRGQVTGGNVLFCLKQHSGPPSPGPLDGFPWTSTSPAQERPPPTPIFLLFSTLPLCITNLFLGSAILSTSHPISESLLSSPNSLQSTLPRPQCPLFRPPLSVPLPKANFLALSTHPHPFPILSLSSP